MTQIEAIDKLDDTEVSVLEALLTSKNQTEAAEIAEVSRSTVVRALANPDFQEAYRASKRAAVEHAATRAQSTLDTAMDRLDEILTADTCPADTRLKAIKMAFDFALKTSEFEGLDADGQRERNKRKMSRAA